MGQLGLGVRAAAWMWYGPARRGFRRVIRPMLETRETIVFGPLAGTRYPHDLVGRLGVYEMDTQRLMAREIASGATVLDVGANYGFFSLLAAHLVGPAGKVVAVEPVPELADGLRRLLVNGQVVVEAAVSDREGESQLYMGNAKTASLSVRQAGSVTVATTTLDRIADEVGPVSFVKMDIEGAEADALRGAVGMLERDRPKLAVEIHNADLDAEIRPLLASFRYEIVESHPLRRGAAYPLHVFTRPH